VAREVGRPLSSSSSGAAKRPPWYMALVGAIVQIARCPALGFELKGPW
jgi:hypothetical protein